MESAFNDTIITNLTTGTASAVSRYVYYKDSAGVRIDSTGELTGYGAQSFGFDQHTDDNGVSYLGSRKSVVWPDATKDDWICSSSLLGPVYSFGAIYGNGRFVTNSYAGGSYIASSNDGITWIQARPVATTTDFSWARGHFAFGQNLFVTCGDSKIATSPDGVFWTTQYNTYPTSGQWNIPAYVGSLFLVSSTAGDIITSPDGLTWTPRTSVLVNNINGFFYGGGLYFAFGDSGDLATSPDGITWTARTSQFGTDSVLGMIQLGSTFIIYGSNGKVSSSTNGLTWTARTSTFGTTLITSAEVLNGTALIVGMTGKGAVSSDGATWTSVTTGFGTDDINYVTTFKNKFIATRAGGGVVRYSSDGVTWLAGTGSTANSSTFAHGNGRIIDSGQAVQTYSGDGITWTASSISSLNSFSTLEVVHYALGKFFATGAYGYTYTSTDGMTWTETQSPFSDVGSALTSQVEAFANNGTLLIAGGVGGKLYSTTDGLTWTSRSSTFSTDAIRGACYSSALTLFVIVGDNGKLATSPDGTTWTSRTSSFSTTGINDVAYSSTLSLFVAVGNSGKLATSSDGITWTQRTSSFGTTAITSVTALSGTFVAAAAGTTSVASSTDGITWTQRTNTVTGQRVASGGGRFVLAGNSAYASSTDGITWTAKTHSDIDKTMYGVVYATLATGISMFVMVGANARIIVSADGTFGASRTIDGVVLAATDGGNGVVAPYLVSAGVAYSSGANAPRVLTNGVQIRFSSTGSVVGPVLSDRIVRSLAAATASNDLTTAGALSCGLLTSYTSPSVYTEVSAAYHTDYARIVNNLTTATGHKITLAQAMNFSFPLLPTTASITHLAVFLTSSGALAWVLPLPTPIPSGTTVGGFSIAAQAPVLTLTDATTVAP